MKQNIYNYCLRIDVSVFPLITRTRAGDLLLYLSGHQETFWELPTVNGFSDWTRVRTVIKRLFNVIYHRDYVLELLRAKGWSVQKVVTRAAERDEDMINEWKGKKADGSRIKVSVLAGLLTNSLFTRTNLFFRTFPGISIRPDLFTAFRRSLSCRRKSNSCMGRTWRAHKSCVVLSLSHESKSKMRTYAICACFAPSRPA